VEADSGNGYAPGWGMLLMMMIYAHIFETVLLVCVVKFSLFIIFISSNFSHFICLLFPFQYCTV